MTRKKVKLAFITNDSARKATYKKRKRGLLKKMDELTTLCDVKACAVLYSPFENKPVVWPGTSGARDVISSFKRLPEMEKVKKMVSQEEFLRQRVTKAHEQLKRQQKENREKEMTRVMYQCLTGKSLQNLSFLDLSDLGYVINQHLIEINKRMVALKKEAEDHPLNNNTNNKSDITTTTTTTTATNNYPSVQQGVTSQNLEGQNGDFESMQMQMLMQQPWSSYLDMMAAPIVNNHHHNQFSQPMSMGMGSGLGTGMGMGSNGGENNGISGSSSNNNNNNMNMMMMGQYGDYQGQGHGVNTSSWSNQFMASR